MIAFKFWVLNYTHLPGIARIWNSSIHKLTLSWRFNLWLNYKIDWMTAHNTYRVILSQNHEFSTFSTLNPLYLIEILSFGHNLSSFLWVIHNQNSTFAVNRYQNWDFDWLLVAFQCIWMIRTVLCETPTNCLTWDRICSLENRLLLESHLVTKRLITFWV